MAMANVAEQTIRYGKRDRSSLEDDMEFMPLSKRIQTINLNQNTSEHHDRMHQINLDNEMPLQNLSFQDSQMSFQDCDSHVPMSQDYHNDFVEPSLASLYLGGDSNDSNQSRGAIQAPERNVEFNQNIQDPHSIKYNPSLPVTQNPHYYHQNQALFYLYLERVHRNRQLPHANCLQ